jgi:hypothetical protein
MSIFRGHLPQDNFTPMANHWFRDPRLGGKAKGYMGYIATNTAEYELSVKQLIAEMADGRDAVYAGLTELVTFHYLIRDQGRRDDGKRGEVTYRFGPAAYEQQYERAWGRHAAGSAPLDEVGKPGSGPDQAERDVSPAQTASGKPVSGPTCEDDVSAGQTASGFAGSGFAGSGRSDTKKISSKEISSKKDQNPHAPARASAPTAPDKTETRGGDSQETNPHRETTQGTPPGANTAAVAEACRLQPSWTPQAAATALRQAIADGHPEALARRALIALAAGEFGATTTGPQRLNAPAGPWWKPGELFVPAPRPSAAPTCRRHRGQPANNCAPCRSEQLAAVGEDEGTKAGPALTAAAARKAARACLLERKKCFA